MILDRLVNAGRYFAPDSRFGKGFAYLRQLKPNTPDGRFPIESDGLYVVVMTYETKARPDARLEAHRLYADIQVVLDGAELCEWTPTDGLTVAEAYDASRDALFFADSPSVDTFALTPGRFAVFYPEDAHKPSCHLAGRATIRKAVVKVRL